MWDIVSKLRIQTIDQLHWNNMLIWSFLDTTTTIWSALSRLTVLARITQSNSVSFLHIHSLYGSISPSELTVPLYCVGLTSLLITYYVLRDLCRVFGAVIDVLKHQCCLLGISAEAPLHNESHCAIVQYFYVIRNFP